MKQKLKKLLLQDLFIGAWVQEIPDTTKVKSFPMFVSAIFSDGNLYLDFNGNESDPFDSNIKEIRGIEIQPDILRGFHFEETDHNVFEKKCDGFKVVVTINDHQHYKLLRAGIHHDNGGFQFDENIIYIHHLQDFVFRSTRKPLNLSWQ